MTGLNRSTDTSAWATKPAEAAHEVTRKGAEEGGRGSALKGGKKRAAPLSYLRGNTEPVRDYLNVETKNMDTSILKRLLGTAQKVSLPWC